MPVPPTFVWALSGATMALFSVLMDDFCQLQEFLCRFFADDDVGDALTVYRTDLIENMREPKIVKNKNVYDIQDE